MMINYFILFVFLIRFSFLANFSVKNGRIVDENQRESIFHGVNVIYKLPPFYPETDHFNPNNSLSSEDAKLLKKWGFNIVRLYIAWPGVSPSENMTFDEEYVKQIQKITQILGNEGIYTLLDLHQDIGSRFICGEGIPDWMYQKLDIEHEFPLPFKYDIPKDQKGYPILKYCLEHGDYTSTFAAQTLWGTFYEKGSFLYQQLVDFWDNVSKYFSSNEYVMGYEIINEPPKANFYKDPLVELPGFVDKKYLAPLYTEIFQTIRKNIGDEKSQLIFFEPMVSDKYFVGLEKSPDGEKHSTQAVFSYHLYCSGRDHEGTPKHVWECDLHDDLFITLRTSKWEELGTGVMVTEFGSTTNSTKSMESIEWMLNELEKRFTGWVYWQYKNYYDYTCSSNDTESFFDAQGQVEMNKVKAMSRTFSQYTCGKITYNVFDPKSSKYEMHFEVQKSSSFNSHHRSFFLHFCNNVWKK